MSTKKNKSLLFITISIIIFIPNLLGLIFAIFVLDQAREILYILPAIMLIVSVVGFSYGIFLRKKAGRS